MTRAELLGRDFLAVFAPDDRAALLSHLAEAFDAQQAAGLATILQPRGDERQVEYSMHLLSGGRPLVAATFGDVTDVRRLTRRATLLAQIASHAAFEGSLESALDKLAEGVVQATGTTACGVCLVDADDQQFRVFGSYGIPKDPDAEVRWKEAVLRGARMPGAESIRQRRPLIHLDARKKLLDDPAYEPIYPWLREAAWDAVVSLPLIYRGRAIGSLNVFYPRGKNPGEPEIAFLSAIADQTAVTAEDARLFTDAKDKAILEERHRLARELHDSVSQALYGIALGAKTARTLLDRHPAEAAEPLDYVLSLAEAGLTEMRSLIFELRPETLETDGLVAALTKQIDAARARHGLEVEAEWCREPDLPYEIKEAVYRIAQEALNNIIKHARARRVEVRLTGCEEDVVLEVKDDGIGFASEDSFPGHLGLRSMRERATRLGGTLRVESAPHQGTQIRVTIPQGSGPR
jgi:signal transduction histidine kinase